MISKGPLIQLVNESAIDIVFEIRDGGEEVDLDRVIVDYGGTQIQASMKHDEREVFIYRARINTDIMQAGRYTIRSGRWESRSYINDALSRATLAGKVKIGVVGDNQFGAVRFSRTLEALRGHEVDLLIHLGDAVQDSMSARAWQTDFFDPLAHYGFLDVPMVLLRGNHDAPSVYTSSPQPDGIPGFTSFVVHHVFFLVLDSNTDSELQDRFVESALKSSAAQEALARIVLVHIPPFVEYWESEPWRSGEKLWGEFVRTRYVPLFNKYHVELVISGHQHNYQRGTQAGVTYIIAGGAGGTLDKEVVEDYGFNEVTHLQHHFGVLEIEASQLRWQMFFTNGQIGDEVTI